MNQAYPWLFHRNEVDLLEDEIEDLFFKHGRGLKSNAMSFEVRVLREQMRAEEQSEAELAWRLGVKGIGLFAGSDDSESRYSDQVRSHPLYQFSRLWARSLRDVGKSGYMTSGEGRKDYFRIFANANLVPIKIFIALLESGQEDQIGLEVARESYGLTLLFLGRIQDSLVSLRNEIGVSSLIERLIIEGESLRKVVQIQSDELGQSGRFV
jgi:hypothetical protein